MMLLPSYAYWTFNGGGSYDNYNSKSYLEVTKHANKRSRQRNIRKDSVLALAEYAIQHEPIRKGNDEYICVRHLGEIPEDNVVIPFGVKRNKAGDVILTAITAWRYLNQDDDFFYEEGQRIFDVKFDKVGRVKIEEVKDEVVLRKIK